MATPFGNYRIIDLSQGAPGAFCTKYFADYGADVVKVEPPRVGDETRRTGPFFHDDPHPEKSLLFLYLNCNKRGVTLEVGSPSGQELLRELLGKADVLVESAQPGYLQSIGLGYEELERLNPRLVVTSITPFGQSGPHRGYQGNDLVYYAMSGLMYTSGAYDREPLKHGHPQSLYMGGITAAYATAAALYAREADGRGQHVDLSLAEATAAHHYTAISRYSYAGLIERRAPKVEGGSFKGAGFEGIVPAADGYIGPSTQQGRQRGTLAEFAALTGHPEIDAPQFATPQQRQERAAEFDALVLPLLRQMKKYDFFDAAMADGWVAGVVQTQEDLARCPTLHERGYFAEVDHPVMGKLMFPGELFRLPGAPWSLRRPAPLLGQHNGEIFCGELGYTRDDLVLLRQQGTI
ncbi:MAG: CoA transferase [Chloroflexi bacterium]|nr:CoA transferase [Chloroflexota bacterium]